MVDSQGRGLRLKKTLTEIMKAFKLRSSVLSSTCWRRPPKGQRQSFNKSRSYGENIREGMSGQYDDYRVLLQDELDKVLMESKSLTKKLEELRRRFSFEFDQRMSLGTDHATSKWNYQQNHANERMELCRNSMMTRENDQLEAEKSRNEDQEMNESRHRDTSVSPLIPKVRSKDQCYSSGDYAQGPASTSTISGTWCEETNEDTDTQSLFDGMRRKFPCDIDIGEFVSYTPSMHSESQPSTHQIFPVNYFESLERHQSVFEGSITEETNFQGNVNVSSQLELGQYTSQRSPKHEKSNLEIKCYEKTSSQSIAGSRDGEMNVLQSNLGQCEIDAKKFLEIPFSYFSSVLNKEEIDCLDEHLKHLTEDDFVPLCFIDYIYDIEDRQRVMYHFHPDVIPRKYKQKILEFQPEMEKYFQFT